MLIDPAIRDKVLIPLLVLAYVYMSLRDVMYKLVLSKPDESMGIEEIRQRQIVARAQRLRVNGNYITGSGFAMRKSYLIDEDGRALREKTTAKPMNPMAQMDVMKGQMVGQAVYMGIWYAVQSSLQGFLLVKLPFALTERFKQITQAGISIAALDTSYVSSGSLFMIALFGLPRFLSLFSKNKDQFDESRMMQMQMGMMGGAAGGMGGGQQAWEAAKQYENERKALETAGYNCALLEGEAQLLALAGVPDAHADILGANGSKTRSDKTNVTGKGSSGVKTSSASGSSSTVKKTGSSSSTGGVAKIAGVRPK